MIYFEYRRADGSIVTSTIKDCPQNSLFTGYEDQHTKIGNSRNLFKRTDFGSVRLVIVDEKEYLASSKLAKKALEAYSDVYSSFNELELQSKKEFEKAVKLFAHNLIEVQAQLKDKVERIFTDHVRTTSNYKDQKALVKLKIQQNIDKAADDFCQIAKRLDDLEAQVESFRIISGIAKKTPPNTGRYNAKNVLLRNAQPFLSDLKDIEVKLIFFDSDNDYANRRVLIDPKMFGTALHHFFQNATKYVRPNSEITVKLIDLSTKTIQLELNMMSIRIEKHELQSIFEQGVSGVNAGHLKGEGLGMYVMKTALEHFGGSIKIEPDYSKSSDYNDKKYVLNSFRIILPRVVN
jgi:signal transduction histidine kinase